MFRHEFYGTNLPWNPCLNYKCLHGLGTFIKYYKISQLIHTQIIAN